MQVVRRPLWDLTPAYEEFQTLRHEAIQSLPIAGAALLIFAFTLLIVRLARRIATVSLRARIRSSLLRQVAANTVGMMVLVLGLFLVFKVSGLTRLATTVLGGTGLVGLVVGIAFRDIAENFLASILISTQRPFQLGDLIEVDGVRGYVQNVTTRGTLLMTVEGNHVQIPNSLIYKNKVFNFTANPNERFSFRIGIDYEDSVSAAQELALATVLENPAVLRDPEPMVLLEELGASTVNLRIYYWVNIREHSGLKVLSSVQRLVKSAFQRAGITMPDAAREIIFPQGVPVRRIDPHATHRPGAPPAASAPGQADDQVVAAEGSLTTDAQVVQSQAKLARLPSAGTSLLEE